MFDPLFIACAVVAVLLVGLSKSGFAVSMGAISVPLLSIVMPTTQAAGMMLPVLIVLDVVAIIVYRRAVDWRVFWIIIPGAMVGTVIGWALAAVTNDHAVGLAVGVISVVFALDAWLPLRKKLEGLPPSRPWGWFWGAIAGFTSFVSHTGGPPYQVYAVPLRLPPLVFSGTTAIVFAVINASKLYPYYTLGQLNVANLEMAAMLIPVALAGMAIGVWLVKRVPAAIFYKIAYVLIFLLGLKLIFDGITGLLAG